MQLPFLDPRSTGPGLAEGIGSIGDALTQAAQMQQQRRQQAAENLRQQQQDKRQAQMDFQSTLMKAHELAKAGDIEGAKSLMSQYGAQADQREAPADKPWSAGLNPDEVDFANSLGDMVQGQNAGPSQTGALPAQSPPPQMQPSQGDPEAEARPGMSPAPAQPPPFDPNVVNAAAADPTKNSKLLASQQPAFGPDGKRTNVTFWNPDTQHFDTRGGGNTPEDQITREALARGVHPLDIRMPSIEEGGPDAPLPMSQGAPTPASNPLVAAAQAQQEKQRQMATILRGQGPGGQQWTIDPDAERNAWTSRADKAMSEAGAQGGEQGDIVRELYPQMRAAALASGQPLDSNEALKYIQSELHNRRIEASDKERGDTAQKRLDQQLEIEKMKEDARTALETQQQGGGKYKRGKGAAGAGTGGGTGYNLKTDQQNEKQLKSIDAETEKFRKGGLDKAIAAYKELQRGEHEMNSTTNPTTQIGIIDRLVKSNTGGKATMQSIKLQLEHMGGLDAQLQGWLEGKETGQLGAKQMANLKAAVSAAKASALAEITDFHDTFVRSRFTGADYAQKGNWENAHESLFGSVTNDKGKPIFQTEHDPNAPTIVRGSGRRSTATVGVGAKGGNALSTAASVSKLPPADQALATQALATKPGDAHYASAQKWLQVHGIQ